MEKIKSSLSNMVLVLVGFAVLIGALLAWVNHMTEVPIAEKADKTLRNGIQAVMQAQDIKVAQADTVKQMQDGKQTVLVVHRVTDATGKNLGAAVESTVMGFGGDLKVLVGFDSEGSILGYTILQTSETPGLGMKADKWFQKDGKGNVIGKCPADGELTVSKDGGDVDAITASTITSRAFLKAINQAYAAYAHPGVDGNSGASSQMKKKCQP